MDFLIALALLYIAIFVTLAFRTLGVMTDIMAQMAELIAPISKLARVEGQPDSWKGQWEPGGQFVEEPQDIRKSGKSS